MTYKLETLTFTNDFAFIELNSGIVIVFNIVDEQLDSVTGEVNINRINMAVIDENGEQTSTGCIIGLPSKYYSINTDYKEYEGLPLTKDNLKYCTLEVADE